MGVNGSIERYSVTTTARQLTAGGARVVISVSGDDVRFAYREYDLTDNYFVLTDGQSLILDPPGLITDLLFFRAETGSATVQVWRMGL